MGGRDTHPISITSRTVSSRGWAMPSAGRWRRVVAIAVAVLVPTSLAIGLWYVLIFKSPNLLSRAARAYAEHDWAAAAELSRQVLSQRKEDAGATRLLARSSARLGRDDAAIAIYTRRLDAPKIEAEDHFLIGLAYERRGNTRAAATAWNKLLEADHVSPQLLEELARHHLQAHRSEEAIRVAERLSLERGWEARGLMMLGTIRAALKDVSGAAELFRQAIARDPTEVDKSAEPTQLRKLIARTLLRVGQPDLAQAPLEAILASGPDPEASWLQSRVYLQKRDKAQAQSALAHAGTYRADNPLEAEPSPYVGEARCENCHQAIFRDSLASRHTQTYFRGQELDQLPLPDKPMADPDDPEVLHTIKKRDGELREETRVGDKVFSAVIEYAFGTVDRYVTMVSRDAHGGYHISRLSYYSTPEGQGWDRSVLDTTEPTRAHHEGFQGKAIGVRDGLARCLYCHLTNPRTGREPAGPETADRAIGCERCHGPGGHHIAAVGIGLADSAIVNPAFASPAAVSTKQCNDCHILSTTFRDHNTNDPAWTRSQGVGWTLSRCNTESGGAFGCVTCHDPHKNARATTTAQYESKCLNCHADSIPSVTLGRSRVTETNATGPNKRTCPVNQSNGCLQCHMPKVRIDLLHTELTDHYIRVHRQKAPK
jgi:tetratricopeptide (TPR) repeat protein